MYKTVYTTNSVINDLVENNGFEIADAVEGCLLDSLLLYGKNDAGETICIGAFEHYRNEWTSDLKCIIAAGEENIAKVENKFYKLKEQSENDDENYYSIA